MKQSVSSDLEHEAKYISSLKVKRNMGELTPEVVAMCEKQIDEMADAANEAIIARHNAPREDFSPVTNALKACPEDLALVCMFADNYDEVLKWNKLHRKKLLSSEVTVSHRETDIAIFHKICEKYRDTCTNDIAKILYNWAHAKNP